MTVVYPHVMLHCPRRSTIIPDVQEQFFPYVGAPGSTQLSILVHPVGLFGSYIVLKQASAHVLSFLIEKPYLHVHFSPFTFSNGTSQLSYFLQSLSLPLYIAAPHYGI